MKRKHLRIANKLKTNEKAKNTLLFLKLKKQTWIEMSTNSGEFIFTIFDYIFFLGSSYSSNPNAKLELFFIFFNCEYNINLNFNNFFFFSSGKSLLCIQKQIKQFDLKIERLKWKKKRILKYKMSHKWLFITKHKKVI